MNAAVPVSSWKSIYFLFNATTDYVSKIEEMNERAAQYLISPNLSLQSELDNALDKSEQTSKELENLQNVSGDSLGVEQQQMFTSIVKLKFLQLVVQLQKQSKLNMLAEGQPIWYQSVLLRLVVLRLAVALLEKDQDFLNGWKQCAAPKKTASAMSQMTM